MKHVKRTLAVVALVLVCALVSMNAQNKKQKVALIHNGHVIVVAPEAVPAHLAHGDTYANESNSYAVTTAVIGGNGTITGPGMIAAGDSATYTITPTLNGGTTNWTLYSSMSGGANQIVGQGNGDGSYLLKDVTGPVTLSILFY
jgi:hypothetical protein